MKKETEDKLACSLTAETTELVPFLPYLLQDFWELGSSPKDMIGLIEKHMSLKSDSKILDLACGKGAVSVNIAKKLGINIYGFDLITEFIEYAKNKAKEFNVSDLCHFQCADVNEIVDIEKDYDCVIFGAAGNILGNPEETLKKLKNPLKTGFGGYIIIDEAFLPDTGSNEEVKYKNYDYLTHKEWLSLFENNGLKLVEELQNDEDYDFDTDNKNIVRRANELIMKYPQKRAIFEGYIKSQSNECTDLERNVIAVTWMLQKLR
ncbi:MAG: class I SAM-dependent methyltransferase [Defluviitaleaceae bacterium]|nr:class I SAM-dependent methyltransferase [Defluviitaleaceae bacterium]